MCLTVYAENFDARVAEEDIVCYKVLDALRCHDGSVEMFSPYYGYEYTPNLLVESDLEHDGWQLDSLNGLSFFEIEKGLHSFVTFSGADYEVGDSVDFLKNAQIFAAIIPKGSEYYVGDFVSQQSYASSALIVLPPDDPRAVAAFANRS